MTLCIAASCLDAVGQSRIVVCHDRRVTTELGSSDTMLKVRLLPHGLVCLVAGIEHEILAVVPLITRGLNAETVVDETNIKPIVERALLARKVEKIEEILRGKLGLSYDHFLKFGKNQLSDDMFRETQYEIAMVQLEAEFIVCGFTKPHDPQILETDRNFKVKVREEYAAIGSGAVIANAVLIARDQNYGANSAHVIYNLFDAKKYAERVTTVSENVAISVIYPDNAQKDVSIDGMADLLAKYERFGPKRIASVSDITFDEKYLKPGLRHHPFPALAAPRP